MPSQRPRNTGAAQITGLQITLGDTSYNFDGVVDNATSGDVEFTVMNPDVVNDGIRSDVLEILYQLIFTSHKA